MTQKDADGEAGDLPPPASVGVIRGWRKDEGPRMERKRVLIHR
jgi:hypothetical protein